MPAPRAATVPRAPRSRAPCLDAGGLQRVAYRPTVPRSEPSLFSPAPIQYTSPSPQCQVSAYPAGSPDTRSAATVITDTKQMHPTPKQPRSRPKHRQHPTKQSVKTPKPPEIRCSPVPRPENAARPTHHASPPHRMKTTATVGPEPPHRRKAARPDAPHQDPPLAAPTVPRTPRPTPPQHRTPPRPHASTPAPNHTHHAPLRIPPPRPTRTIAENRRKTPAETNKHRPEIFFNRQCQNDTNPTILASAEK